MAKFVTAAPLIEWRNEYHAKGSAPWLSAHTASHNRDTPAMDGQTNRELVDLLDGVDVNDTPLDELIGAQTVKSDDKIAVPLVFEYSSTTRRTTYRKGTEIGHNTAPADTIWVDIDPRLSLRRALEIYGPQNLYAYDKLTVAVDRRG
jgi:hypothetical protein